MAKEVQFSCQEIGKLFFGEPPPPMLFWQTNILPVPSKYSNVAQWAGLSVYQSVRPSVSRGPLPGFIIWQLSEKIKRPNAPSFLLLLLLLLWVCACVCVCAIPYNHRTKPKGQEQEAGFKGVKETCTFKGWNAALQRRKGSKGGKEKGYIHQISLSSIHLPIKALPIRSPLCHLWPFLRAWQRKQTAVSGWLCGWIIGATWNKTQQSIWQSESMWL